MSSENQAAEKWKTRRDFWGVFPAEGFGDDVLGIFAQRTDAEVFAGLVDHCRCVVVRVLPFEFTMVNRHEESR